MNGLHLFIDNSSVFSAGGHINDSYDYSLRIDFGKLFEKIKDGRKVNEVAMVGKNLSPKDSLIDKLNDLNVQPKFIGLKNGVVLELTNVIRDTLSDNNDIGTVVLIADDSNYIPVLERCLKRGWSVEVYFWNENFAFMHDNLMKNVNFVNLMNYFEEITHIEKKMVIKKVFEERPNLSGPH